MSRIDNQFRDWQARLAEIDGARLVDPYVEFPEFDIYNKAFRLKMFGRCPKCGGDVTAERDLVNNKTFGGCVTGDLEFSFSDTDMMAAADPDDIVLDIVREALV